MAVFCQVDTNLDVSGKIQPPLPACPVGKSVGIFLINFRGLLTVGTTTARNAGGPRLFKRTGWASHGGKGGTSPREGCMLQVAKLERMTHLNSVKPWTLDTELQDSVLARLSLVWLWPSVSSYVPIPPCWNYSNAYSGPLNVGRIGFAFWFWLLTCKRCWYCENYEEFQSWAK